MIVERTQDRRAHGRHRGPGPARVVLPGQVMTRYYGWYASRTRGTRARLCPCAPLCPCPPVPLCFERFQLPVPGFWLPASLRPRSPTRCVIDAPTTRPGFRIGAKQVSMTGVGRVTRRSSAMDSLSLQFVREPLARADLATIAAGGFGDMIKAVVDVERGIMAIGAELHADEEAALLDDGSRQADLWGINLYPGDAGDTWIEFDSMINVRPAQGNRSRGVDDEATRAEIRRVVGTLVRDA